MKQNLPESGLPPYPAAVNPADDYLEIADNSGIMSPWEWDLDSDNIYITEKTAKDLDLDGNVVSGSDIKTWLAPEDSAEVLKKLKEAISGDIPFDFEINVILPDKTKKWIRVIAKVDYTKNKPAKVRGIYSDITDKKNNEKEISSSSLTNKRTQAIAHLGSWEYIASDGSLQWSDETYRIFGKDPKGFSPTYENFLEAIFEEDRSKVAEAFESSIKNKDNGYEIKHRLVHGITGNIRWVREKCFHSWSNKGELKGSSGMVLDITKEETLTKKYENFFQAIENLSHPVILTETNGEITYANEAFSKFYGYSFDEIIGKTPNILNPGYQVYYDYGYTHEEYDELFSGMWSALKNPEKGVWEGELLNKTKAGELLRVQLYLNSVRNEAGEITSFIGYPIDISEKHLREKEIRFQTIMAIAELAEKRDSETGQHMKRIGDYTWFIASKFDMPKKYCDDIRMFSPLHDIGKVGISDNILLAERKLTEDEFEIMKTHTTIGYQILKDRPLMEMAADIAHCHQEKYDGSGYPSGFKGNDIPLSARITAIADVYDALRSERPYKKPYSHSKAVEIMLEGRGSHFDPELMDIFIENQHEFNRIFEEFKD